MIMNGPGQQVGPGRVEQAGVVTAPPVSFMMIRHHRTTAELPHTKPYCTYWTDGTEYDGNN